LTILIFIDLTATLFWIHGGMATEANPMMNFFFEQSSFLFVVAKLGFSFAGIYLLYSDLNFIYVGVCMYHLWGMLFLLFKTN
jgi:hypothetical protein